MKFQPYYQHINFNQNNIESLDNMNHSDKAYVGEIPGQNSSLTQSHMRQAGSRFNPHKVLQLGNEASYRLNSRTNSLSASRSKLPYSRPSRARVSLYRQIAASQKHPTSEKAPEMFELPRKNEQKYSPEKSWLNSLVSSIADPIKNFIGGMVGSSSNGSSDASISAQNNLRKPSYSRRRRTGPKVVGGLNRKTQRMPNSRPSLHLNRMMDESQSRTPFFSSDYVKETNIAPVDGDYEPSSHRIGEEVGLQSGRKRFAPPTSQDHLTTINTNYDRYIPDSNTAGKTTNSGLIMSVSPFRISYFNQGRESSHILSGESAASNSRHDDSDYNARDSGHQSRKKIRWTTRPLSKLQKKSPERNLLELQTPSNQGSSSGVTEKSTKDTGQTSPNGPSSYEVKFSKEKNSNSNMVDAAIQTTPRPSRKNSTESSNVRSTLRVAKKLDFNQHPAKNSSEISQNFIKNPEKSNMKAEDSLKHKHTNAPGDEINTRGTQSATFEELSKVSESNGGVKDKSIHHDSSLTSKFGKDTHHAKSFRFGTDSNGLSSGAQMDNFSFTSGTVGTKKDTRSDSLPKDHHQSKNSPPPNGNSFSASLEEQTKNSHQFNFSGSLSSDHGVNSEKTSSGEVSFSFKNHKSEETADIGVSTEKKDRTFSISPQKPAEIDRIPQSTAESLHESHKDQVSFDSHKYNNTESSIGQPIKSSEITSASTSFSKPIEKTNEFKFGSDDISKDTHSSFVFGTKSMDDKPEDGKGNQMNTVFKFDSASTSTTQLPKATGFSFSSAPLGSNVKDNLSKNTSIQGFGSAPNNTENTKSLFSSGGFGNNFMSDKSSKTEAGSNLGGFTFSSSSAKTSEEKPDISDQKPNFNFTSGSTSSSMNNLTDNGSGLNSNMGDVDKKLSSNTVSGFSFGPNSKDSSGAISSTMSSGLKFDSNSSNFESVKPPSTSSGFTFGSNSANTTETTQSNTTTGFRFGAVAANSGIEKSSTENSGFRFGQSSSNTSSPFTTSSNGFGVTSNSTNAANPASANKADGFNFSSNDQGNTLSEAPKPNLFTFGSNTTNNMSVPVSSAASPFSFGSNSMISTSKTAETNAAPSSFSSNTPMPNNVTQLPNSFPSAQNSGNFNFSSTTTRSSGFQFGNNPAIESASSGGINMAPNFGANDQGTNQKLNDQSKSNFGSQSNDMGFVAPIQSGTPFQFSTPKPNSETFNSQSPFGSQFGASNQSTGNDLFSVGSGGCPQTAPGSTGRRRVNPRRRTSRK